MKKKYFACAMGLVLALSRKRQIIPRLANNRL